MRIWAALLTTAVLTLAGSAVAQPPRPCEERLAEFRIYAELLATSRTRTELEATQAVAALRRENEALRAEVGRLQEAMKNLPQGQTPTVK